MSIMPWVFLRNSKKKKKNQVREYAYTSSMHCQLQVFHQADVFFGILGAHPWPWPIHLPVCFSCYCFLSLILVRSYHLPIDFIFLSSVYHPLPTLFDTQYRKDNTTYELCIRYGRYNEIYGAHSISERIEHFIKCQKS